MRLRVEPGIFASRKPVVIKRFLIDKQFNRRAAYRTTKVIVSLNLDFDFFSEAKSFFLTVLLRSFYLNLEFRQFVLFKSKQSRGTDVVSATRVPKLNVVL